MERSIQKLTQVPGVIGAVVFDEMGTCIAEALQPPYEAILLIEVLGLLRDVYDNYLALGDSENPKTLAIAFDAGHLLIRRQDGFTLMVLGTEEVNLAMLGVSINVVVLKLGRPPAGATSSGPTQAPPIFSGPPPIPSGPPPIPTGRSVTVSHSVSTGVPVTTSQTPSQRVPATNSTQSGPTRRSSRATIDTSASSSISWTSEGLNGQKPPPDSVGLAVMRHVLKALARRIGAVDARAIIEEELRNIGATPATVRASQFTDIIHSIANRMPNPGDRSAFISDALGDSSY